MTSAAALTLFQLLQGAAALVLAWRLLHFHLQREMPAMLVLQFWIAFSSALVACLFSHAISYIHFYTFVIPLNCFVNILAVREVISLVFIRYPGITTVGRWMMYGSIALSTAASLLLATLFQGHTSGKSVELLVLLERSVSFCLAIFILCILFCLSRYPLHLPRNFSVSSSLFCVIFLTEALALVLSTINATPHKPAVDIGLTIIETACLIYWVMMLQPADAPSNVPRPSSTPLVWSGSDETTLLEQLEGLNRVMSRAVRRQF